MLTSALKLAIQEAQSPSESRHNLGAVLFRGGKIISSGRNGRRHARNLHPKYKKAIDSLCAEKAAILKARTDLRGASILVVRVGRDGSLLLAKPCDTCKLYLDYVGIKSVFYSDSYGQIVRVTPQQLLEAA